MTKDLFGNALLDYYNGNYTEDLLTETSISDTDVLPLPYLFRAYNEMPKIEQMALNNCYGKILDIGAGAGSHSLHLQQKGYPVKAIDISKGAISVCKQRGIINAEVCDILNETESFDTLLLLMNGTGIFKTLAQTPDYLKHLKGLLNPEGQILIDSSDIAYMYQDDDGGQWIDTNAAYYGELDYFLSYKGEHEAPMTWLYLDYDSLSKLAASVGLQCECIAQGEHYDYLARLTLTP